MTVYTVTTNADSGTGSLRAAITSANTDPGSTIQFDSSVFTGGAASAITLLSDLPEIDASVTIDASTATGVTIDGNHLYQGLFVASGTVVKSMQVRVFENGSTEPKLTQAVNAS